MKHCIWCMDVINIDINWSNILFPPGQVMLCENCQYQLEYVPMIGCSRCHRVSKHKVCSDCEWWQSFYNGEDPLRTNISVFRYNDFLQAVITKWKYRGDYLLGDLFMKEMKTMYVRKLQPHLPKDALILPIPLSAEREYERAFNQATQLTALLPLEKGTGFRRMHSEKQSKKSRKERMSAVNPFKLEKPINKTVVLVDDIYTTGRTLRHAAELLIASGTPAVYALTLARG